MKRDTADVSKAFQGKTKSVTVRPTKIGENILTDLEYILYNTLLTATKEIPSDKKLTLKNLILQDRNATRKNNH